MEPTLSVTVLNKFNLFVLKSKQQRASDARDIAVRGQ